MRFPAPTKVPGSVAIFADAHLGQAEKDGEDFLAALEALYERGFRTVVLLGDIFHYFIGSRKFETPLLRQVLDGWASLAARGVSFRYIEGNRDFFLDGSPFAVSFAAYGLTDGLELGGKRYAFVHGDRVNTSDLPYRFFRVLSKNPVSRAVLKVMPGALARTIVKQTEARLYTTNFKHKTHLPHEALVEEGRRARRAGYEEVLIGHFHVEKHYEEADGIARILPAWLEERKHAEIAPDGTLTIVEEPSASRAVKRTYAQ
ncbi:MAG: metallophosphoesterase [Acidobacteria bacterium]|nr:metallophosphoesterase [Acidobacteriota bacterium]